MERRYISLSRKMSLALRHDPGKFGITLKTGGWTSLPVFLRSMGVSRSDLNYIQANSNKQRFEVDNHRNQIRAIYGHSANVDIGYKPIEPPRVLYHGTTDKVARVVLREGLKSMSRQYVHYSTDVATAMSVGGRHCDSPVILVIRALDAHLDGLEFYHGNEDIWMSKDMPSDYIARKGQ